MADAPAAALAQAGVDLLRQGRGDEALATFRKVLDRSPGHPLALRNLGVLLAERGRHAEALALADETLARAAGHAAALLLRAEALASLARYDAASPAYEAALAAGAPAYEVLAQWALTLVALGRHEEALAALDRAVALDPDAPLARHRRGIVRLQLGDFGGWDDYEARFGLKRFLDTAGGQVNAAMAAQLTRAPSPAELAGQRVLLLGEQGIGDQVMFASMIPDLANVARSVTCICEPRLVRLFAASFPQVAFAGPAEARVRRPEIDRVVAMGSLGAAFRRRPEDFPGAAYLAPSAAAKARWAERLGRRTASRRIGVSWRGGLPNTRRDQRSLEVSQLRSILALPDCEIVSLQYGDVAAELAAADAPAPIRAFPPQDLHDFDDLAGLVANLDLVVSVQTALVHLTGALGRPCLTLVPFNAEWRYMAKGAAMPWYGSVRLFRQAAPGDWAPVVTQAAEAAARLEC